MKKLIVCFTLLFALILCSGCSSKATLNGTDLSEYTIVYAPNAPDYCQRAAAYIQQQILSRTGVELQICEAGDTPYDHEIVVGQTNRVISQQLDAETENVEFAMLADENHIALEGDYFIIAAAAYYFVENFIPGESFQSTVPAEVTVCQPITEKANNFMFLIGDGMGVNHTKMIGTLDMADALEVNDREDIFYGYYLPYQGVLRTSSLSGTTDSAAGATALACGYKTINSYVGKDQNLEDVQSLTELAASKGMATAVMSTDLMTGATPAGFSAHAEDRDNSDRILACQRKLMEQGTLFTCNLHSAGDYQEQIVQTVEELEKNENGFFLMYEEAYVDKFSHKWDLQGAFSAMVRFNQAIGLFMEYAFYNPDTFLLITADHETGGLMPDKSLGFAFQYEGHTPADVPIFAYGQGAEVFRDYNEENNEVPKVIAALWGVSDFGDNG